MSLAITIQTGLGALCVARDNKEGNLVGISVAGKNLNFLLPKLTREDGQIKLSFLILGMKRFPRVPKGMFHRVLSDAGLPAIDELFETAQHVNRMFYLDLLRTLESVENPVAHTVRQVCLMQLETLSHAFGVRPI